jgi:mono/diheme cytochrome c family protein
MRKELSNFIILAAAVTGLSLSGCGTAQVDLSTVTPAQIQAYASALTPAQLQAYTAALTPAQIQTIGGSLTFAQLQAIAPFLALVTGSTAGATATPDGTALYTSNCAGCHGPLATSSKRGATTARTQSAIGNNIGAMGLLSNSLTINQMQAITTALADTSSGTGTGGTTAVNGSTLYSINCANCHGALASSGKLGATAARTQSAINSNSGGMGSLSSMSAADVQAIASALAVTGTTGSGSTGGSTSHPFGWTNPESSHRNYVDDNGTAGCISCHSIDQASKGQKMSCFNCHGDKWGGSGGGDD